MEDSNRQNVREARDAALMAQKNGYMATMTAIRIVREIHVAFSLFGMVLGFVFVLIGENGGHVGYSYIGASYTAVCAVLGFISLKKASQINIA